MTIAAHGAAARTEVRAVAPNAGETDLRPRALAPTVATGAGSGLARTHTELGSTLAIAVVIVVLTTGKQHHHDTHHHEQHADFDIIGKVFEMAREKPLWAAGAAVAAGLLAIRNPALVATIVAAFMDRPGSKPGR